MKQSKRHFTEALRAQPNHFWAQCLLAICDLNSRKANSEEARAYLTACLQSHPDSPWLYLLRGFASGQIASRALSPEEAAANFAAALADYDEALSRDSGGRFAMRRWSTADCYDCRARSQTRPSPIWKRRFRLIPAVERLCHAGPGPPPTASARSRAHRAWPRSHSNRILPPFTEPGPLDPRGAHLSASDRAFALADLDRAIQFGIPNSREQARDLTEKGRVLLLDKHFQQALDACDAALRIEPKDNEVHRYRVRGAPGTERYGDAIVACDAALRTGTSSADLLGLADWPGPGKMNSRPRSMTTLWLWRSSLPHPSCTAGADGRIWYRAAAQLAVRDFEHAIRLDPSSGEFYSGRGSALVALGRHREAVGDAEESLRHGESDPRLHYSAARILAQAAEDVRPERRPRSASEPTTVQAYQDRALTLLGQAVERTPPDERAAFWRDVVNPDRVFTAIRRHPAYAADAAAAGAHPVR